MTEKLTGGEWMTLKEKIRWHLIRLLLHRGDAAILANATYIDIRAWPSLETGYPLSEAQVETINARRKRTQQLYFVLRWIQRNEK